MPAPRQRFPATIAVIIIWLALSMLCCCRHQSGINRLKTIEGRVYRSMATGTEGLPIQSDQIRRFIRLIRSETKLEPIQSTLLDLEGRISETRSFCHVCLFQLMSSVLVGISSNQFFLQDVLNSNHPPSDISRKLKQKVTQHLSFHLSSIEFH